MWVGEVLNYLIVPSNLFLLELALLVNIDDSYGTIGKYEVYVGITNGGTNNSI